MATIRKHHGKWQVIIRRKGFPHEYKSFATWTDANKHAQDSENKINKGQFEDLSEAMKVSLHDALARYRDEICKTRKWGDLDSYRINKLQTFKIAQYSLARINSNKIVKFRNELAKTMKASTINKYLTLISVVFNTAKTEWDISCVNPVVKIKRLKEPEFSDERLSPEMERELLLHAPRSKMYWMKAFVIVGLESGMRRGELMSLKRKDVDLKNSTAIVRDTKNGTTRKIGLSPKATESLKSIIPSVDGRYFPTHADQFKFYWKQLCGWCGFKIKFHLLRHEFASRRFEAGWDISAVATQGGWKDWKVLRRYTALSPNYLAEKFKKES